MASKAAAFLLSVFFSTFLTPNAVTMQDKNQASSPLTVSAQYSTLLSADCNSGNGMIAQFHYEGAQPLRGYLVSMVLSDSAGRDLTEQTIQEVRSLREQMIATGAEWTRTYCLTEKGTSGNALTTTAKVDVLRFADGSNWGPMALAASHQLVGTMDGMDFSVRTTDLERYISPILPPDGPVPSERIRIENVGPLRFVSGVWRDESGQQLLAVEVTNISDRPIRGFVFTASFFDPATGSRLRRVTTKELETHGNPKNYLLPGATWLTGARKFSLLPDGSLAAYEIIPDLVVFADGSISGTRYSSESEEVLGMFLGIDGANPSSKGTLRVKKSQ